MKTLIRSFLAVIAAAVVGQTQAAYTNYLNEASNTIAFASAQLDQIPPDMLTKEQARIGKALAKALRTLQKPSTSLLADYNIFLSTAIQLLPLESVSAPELAGPISAAMSNAYASFFLEASVQVLTLSNRLDQVTPFQRLRTTAGRQVSQAYDALVNALQTTDPQLGVLFLRNAYTKLAVGTRLTGLAETKSNFAPDSVAGRTLHHQEKGSSGDVEFTDETNYTGMNDEGETEQGTYTYVRTGLKTATLELNDGSGTVTVLLRFKTPTSGKFTFRDVSDEGTFRGSGSFMLTN